MKRISLLLIPILMWGIFSCKNEKWEFPDFDYTAVYFPYQYPVRTLVLGDYSYNNENDNNLKFLISARVSGMYENNSEWKVNFQIDQSLTVKLLSSLGDTIKFLPSRYYTLNPADNLMIPKGEFSGGVVVQLTQAFLDDPIPVKTIYAIPLRIASSTADSVLSGKPSAVNPDPRISGNWSVVPKDFTLFGIKYVNPYHGKYLHRGRSVITTIATGTLLESISYRNKYVEKDEIWALQTISKNEATVSGVLRLTSGSPGKFIMKLAFSDNGDCLISTGIGSLFPVTGTGKFVKDGDAWGNTKRNAIYLSYQVNDGTRTHAISDTLVVRDRDVRFEEFVPVVYP